MRSSTIIASLLAASAPLVQAGLQPKLAFSDLSKRQGGDSFQPGSTLVSSCPAGNLICGNEWCYDPSLGDVCCKGGYACPGGSFCLTDGYCCPDGDDPATCAAANGVTLPANFNTAPAPDSSAAPSAGASSAPAAAASSKPAASVPSPSPAPAPLPATTFPAPIGSGKTLVPTGTASVATTANPAAPSVSQFDGAATRPQQVGGALAIALGLIGYLI